MQPPYTVTLRQLRAGSVPFWMLHVYSEAIKHDEGPKSLSVALDVWKKHHHLFFRVLKCIPVEEAHEILSISLPRVSARVKELNRKERFRDKQSQETLEFVARQPELVLSDIQAGGLDMRDAAWGAYEGVLELSRDFRNEEKAQLEDFRVAIAQLTSGASHGT